MKTIIAIAMLSMTALAYAPLPAKEVARIRSAIWFAEGGDDAVYPYGVKSVHCDTVLQARRVCENSIRNNWERWNESGKTNEFLPFMAARYCPFDQSNWTKNVRHFYFKNK